jgi:HAD superfamily hydrolase (TIGR01509 family)
LDELPDQVGRTLYSSTIKAHMRFKALVFDFDGLILDTETPEVVVWQKLYSDHGQEFPLEKWGQIIGGSGAAQFDAAGHLAGLVAEPVAASAMRQSHRALSDILTMTQPMLDGVLEALDQSQRLGLRTAVASSSDHQWVDTHLRRLRLSERFQVVVCAEDVPPGRTKPHADLFRLAVERLGVLPVEAIALEDSPNGVRAARAAGLFTVAVPNATTARLEFEGEDLRLGSLRELRLAELVAADA